MINITMSKLRTNSYPGQFPSIQFPIEPTIGQEYVADNRVTYTWMGDRWSSVPAITNSSVNYVIDGLYSNSEFDPHIDKTIDGGGAGA